MEYNGFLMYEISSSGKELKNLTSLIFKKTLTRQYINYITHLAYKDVYIHDKPFSPSFLYISGIVFLPHEAFSDIRQQLYFYLYSNCFVSLSREILSDMGKPLYFHLYIIALFLYFSKLTQTLKNYYIFTYIKY